MSATRVVNEIIREGQIRARLVEAARALVTAADDCNAYEGRGEEEDRLIDAWTKAENGLRVAVLALVAFDNEPLTPPGLSDEDRMACLCGERDRAELAILEEMEI